MKEAELQKGVVNLARLHGYRVAHFSRSVSAKGAWHTAVAADAKGFPDLTLAKAGALLFMEIKSVRGVLSPEQKEWQEILGERYFVIRPKDYPDAVSEILRT